MTRAGVITRIIIVTVRVARVKSFSPTGTVVTVSPPGPGRRRVMVTVAGPGLSDDSGNLKPEFHSPTLSNSDSNSARIPSNDSLVTECKSSESSH
jgi:hypothetical protein